MRQRRGQTFLQHEPARGLQRPRDLVQPVGVALAWLLHRVGEVRLAEVDGALGDACNDAWHLGSIADPTLWLGGGMSPDD